MRKLLVLMTLAALVSAGCGTRVERSVSGASDTASQQTAVGGRPLSEAPAPRGVQPAERGAETVEAAGTSPKAEHSRGRGVPIAPGPGAAVSGTGVPQSSSERVTPVDSGGVQPEDPARPPEDLGRVRSELVIGSAGTLSGPVGAVVGQVASGVQAWVSFVNKRGGVRGHRLRLITADDGGDPARHRAIVQDLVEARGVVALVGNPEVLTGRQSVEYLTGKGIPVIGSDGAGDWFYDSPVYFPQAPHGESLMESILDGYAAQTVPKGLKRVALILCLEASACTEGERIWTRDAGKVGFEVVYKARVSLAQPDFTAECLSARRENAQVFATAFDAASIARLARSCLRQGYEPVIGIGSANASPFHTREPGLQNAVVGGIPHYPWFLTDTAAIREFRQGVEEAGLEPLSGYELGWVSGKLFELLVPDVPGAVTASAVLARRGLVRDETLGGLTMPLTFEAGKNAQPRTCGYLVAIENERFVSPDGGLLHCRS